MSRARLQADGLCSTVAVAVWALEDGAVSPTLELVVDDVIEGGVGPIAVDNPEWSPRDVY